MRETDATAKDGPGRHHGSGRCVIRQDGTEQDGTEEVRDAQVENDVCRDQRAAGSASDWLVMVKRDIMMGYSPNGPESNENRER